MEESKDDIIQREIDLDKPHRLSKEARARFDSIKETDIDYTDIPDTSLLWRKFKPALRKPKIKITLPLDKEVLDFFRVQRKCYQTLINTVLKAYVHAHKQA